MSTPVLVVVSYEAKPGSEEQLAGVLRSHVARLRELGLLAEGPTFVGERLDKPGSFLESFRWRDRGAKDIAHDNPEVMEIWMRMEDLCVAEGIRPMPLRVLD